MFLENNFVKRGVIFGDFGDLVLWRIFEVITFLRLLRFSAFFCEIGEKVWNLMNNVPYVYFFANFQPFSEQKPLYLPKPAVQSFVLSVNIRQDFPTCTSGTDD